MDLPQEYADYIIFANYFFPFSLHLAQELVDYIIDFLRDDPTTLLQVSLVSRAWVDRTRTHLFESLSITDSKLSSANPYYLTQLCKYVKTLHFKWPTNANPSSILNRFGRSRLHTLAIHFCELHTLDEQAIRRCFAKFPCTSITSLELNYITSTNETFLILLSLFPNVDDLTISACEWKDEPGANDNHIARRITPPRLSGSFKSFDPPTRRYLELNRGKLLRTIAALSPRFHTVSLGIGEQSREEIGTLLDSCSKTVKKVFLILPYSKSWPCTPPTFLHVQYVNA